MFVIGSLPLKNGEGLLIPLNNPLSINPKILGINEMGNLGCASFGISPMEYLPNAFMNES
jgi:hypothetical protein